MPAPAGIVVFAEKQTDSSAWAGDSKGFACKRIRARARVRESPSLLAGCPISSLGEDAACRRQAKRHDLGSPLRNLLLAGSIVSSEG
jgi:hypothetical protein